MGKWSSWPLPLWEKSSPHYDIFWHPTSDLSPNRGCRCITNIRFHRRDSKVSSKSGYNWVFHWHEASTIIIVSYEVEGTTAREGDGDVGLGISLFLLPAHYLRGFFDCCNYGYSIYLDQHPRTITRGTFTSSASPSPASEIIGSRSNNTT